MIEMARPGRYAITLRHKPETAAFPLQATEARVKVGGKQATAPIERGATAVTLMLELPAGPARLETALTDAASGKTRGAFFVEFERLDR